MWRIVILISVVMALMELAIATPARSKHVVHREHGPHHRKHGSIYLEYGSPATAYCTNADMTYLLSSIQGPSRANSSNGGSDWKLSIDDTPSGYKQTVTGFGAAVTGATVISMNSLSENKLSQLLDELFTSIGAQFSLMRHTIGASDLSPDPVYTYDDNGGHPDPSLSSFGLGERGKAMATMLARISSIASNLTILGTPWSPPGWMKLNGVIDGSTENNNLNDGYLEGNGSRYSEQFAQYFVKYIQAYEDIGAHIDAITIQNEPLNSQSGYPTMYVFSYESADLIRNFVGPALNSAGLDTSIWAYDHNTDVPSYPDTVLSTASEYVDTVAWHCYASSLDWSVLTTFHNNHPGAKQYMTECWTSETVPWYQAANFTIGPLQNWASGAMAWTLATNRSDGPHLTTGGCTHCRGLITVSSNGTYTKTIDYYTMAQFSKFIQQGAVILSGTGSYTYGDGTGIQSVASLNPDGTRTVVIMNLFSNSIDLSLNTTSGELWSGNIPQESVVTWVLPAADRYEGWS